MRLDHFPQLLAPAGDWECLRAAVAHGADAVYFGLSRFNARMRADNFTEEDLPDVMAFLHRHGVKGYVTCNVLIFTEELDEAQNLLDVLVRCRVDAIIVQDVGLAELAHVRHPHLRLHASTQMSITSPEGVALVGDLGVSQVVLARELSLRELRKFREIGKSGPRLEVFVHGALCVAYSGQCLTSEALGQRSANRGECAQACRMPYELVVDGETWDLQDRRYLLSPQDLAAVEEIPSLLEAGVTSFKIEGRLKSPEYVAAVTAVYRRALDRAMAGRECQEEAPSKAVSDEDWYALEMVFSRGLFSGWMHGVDHQKLVPARFGKKRGPLLGRVVRTGPDWVEIDGNLPVRAGDGIVFDQGGDPDREQGGRVYSVGPGRRLCLARGKRIPRALKRGDRVWKTDDPHLTKRLRATWQQGHLPQRAKDKIPVFFTLRGAPGEPLELKMQAADRAVSVFSSKPVESAQQHPLDPERARQLLDHLQETPFAWAGLEWAVEGAIWMPPGELKQLRRAVLERWLAEAPPPASPGPSWQEILARPWSARCTQATPTLEVAQMVRNNPQWSVLCRTEAQIQAALEEGAEELLLDFEDIRRYGPVVAELRGRTQAAIFLATPRIQKAGEEGFFKLIERAQADGVLIRNPGALAFYRESSLRLLGDFSLNVANPLAARFFLERGLERITISYDLTAEQALPLIRALPMGTCEVTLHQHMPMFHMEHCVFAAFMSQGKDYTDCGRPCEKHRVHLRDRVGQLHPLRADVGCRNTLFRQAAQTGAAFFEEFVRAGGRHFRIELLEENGAETRKVLTAYRELFTRPESTPGGLPEGGHFLWQKLRAENRLGVTHGTWQGHREEPGRIPRK